MSYPPTFVRASELYDVHRDERVPINWASGRTLDEPTGADQEVVDAAIEAVVPEGR